MGVIIDSREGSVRFLWKMGVQEYESKAFYRPKRVTQSWIPIHTIEMVDIAPNTSHKVQIDSKDVCLARDQYAEMKPVVLIPVLECQAGILDENTKFIFLENPTDQRITIKPNTPIALVKKRSKEKENEDIIGALTEDGVIFSDEFEAELNKAL